MRNWIHFFVGTPQRFLTTGFAALVTLACIRPDVAQNVLSAGLSAVLGTIFSFAEPILTLVVMILASGWIWRKVFGSGGNKK